MPAKIPTTIITGFLGAGKTTLIRHLVETVEGRRLALIINEFGDLGVDGGILNGCGVKTCRDDDVIELSNGCICCTVADDFIPAIKSLIERDTPPDHIIIETSGLALPQPLVQAFNWPEIRNRVSVDGVIALVDGPAWESGQFAANPEAVERQRAADESLDHATPLGELFADQMTAADMVVITKADLLGDGGAHVKAALGQQTREGTQILSAENGQIDPKILIGLGLATENEISRRPARHNDQAHHRDHDDVHGHGHENGNDDKHGHGHEAFESFVLELSEIESAEDFIEALTAIAAKHNILRIKGFVAVAGKPMRLVVQGVGPRMERYFDSPFGDEPRRTRLVIIGFASMDQRAIANDLST